jgi:murein DD-endopeptidase MepM/ murein hydrolase activator NlpD
MGMKPVRFLIPLMLSAMILVPINYLFQNISEASAIPSTYKPELLLTHEPATPLFDAIRRLERPVVATYFVQGRQDLWSICKRFHVDQFTIRSSNDLDISVFPDGTVLKIPSQKGTLYEVEKPESLHVISQGYARGKTLGNAYEREILQANDFPVPDPKDPAHSFLPGTRLFLPLAYKPTGLQLPFKDLHYRITSGFGMRHHPILGVTRRHDGFDLAKPYGSPVMTSREGVVTFAGWMGGYGNMIEVKHVIKHRNNTRILYTRYGHLSEILVHEGQHLRLYQLIGRVGSTGISTGPHLHFEVRDENGTPISPHNFL